MRHDPALLPDRREGSRQVGVFYRAGGWIHGWHILRGVPMIDLADNTSMIMDQMTPHELQRACEAITRLIALAGKRGDCALMGMAVEKLRLLQRRMRA